MTANFTSARDDVLTMVKNAWDTTGYIMLYDDQVGNIPSTSTPWARSTMKHVFGSQKTLSGALGTQKYSRVGLLTVQIFTPCSQGLSLSDNLAKIIVDAFEGKKSPNDVWFRNVRMNEIGPDGDWYNTNVIIEFEYNEIK